jgi:hypothetical protein
MSIQLQNRDFRIFQELQSCRFLTLAQIADLCFEGKREAAKKRLQKLQHGGHVRRHSPGMLHESIYIIRKRAHVLIAGNGYERSSFKRSIPPLATLRHEILLRDFRTAIFRDAKRAGIEVNLFTIKPEDLRFEIGNKVLRSDGYFEIHVKNETCRYFLEVDLGTEAHSVIVERVWQYRELFKGRLGRKGKSCTSFPFRVLFVFTSDERLHLFLTRLHNTGMKDFVMATTFSLSGQFACSSVWMTARTHRRAETFGLCPS